MYLKRKVDQFLKEWKENEDRKPLIIRGAPGIGKRESILHFARENYKSIVEINFDRNLEYQSITYDGYSPSDIIKNISHIDPTKQFIPVKTLIFFIEITAFPDILTSLKFFRIDGQYDVISCGSIPSNSYRKIRHNSVGYKTDYTMYSLDFVEYLWSKGYDDVIQDMLFHMHSLKPFSKSELRHYCDSFDEYCKLSSMTSVITDYIYKYADNLDPTMIVNTLNAISNSLPVSAYNDEIQECITWLIDTGMVNISYCLDYPELPLNGNYNPDNYKLYSSNAGLLSPNTNSNLNIPPESRIAEELVKSGYSLFFYTNKDSKIKEEFFIRSKDALIPIEVNHHQEPSKSLHTLIESKEYPDIRYSFKLTNGNISYKNHIYKFPYFCTFLLKRFVKEYKPVEE